MTKTARVLLVFLTAMFCLILTFKQQLIENYMAWKLRSETLIISLSTTPHRINDIQETLKSITNQKGPIKAIYLSIPYVFKRDNLPYHIPDWLMENKKINIIRTEDYGPATKLLGVLANVDLPPDAIIITMDDDVDYPSNLALHLAYKASLHPDSAIGLSGANPAYDVNGTIEPEALRGLIYDHRGDTPVRILQGFASIAYRRGFFDSSIFDIIKAPRDCINSDDVYLAFYLAKQKIKRIVLKNKYIDYLSLSWYNPIGLKDDALHVMHPHEADRLRSCLTYMKTKDPKVIF